MAMACNGKELTSSDEYGAEFQICLVGEGLKENATLLNALEYFRLKVVCSETGQEHVSNGAEFTTIFVLSEFEGEVYSQLHKSGQRILGPTAIIQLAKNQEPLPSNVRPLYSIAMRNIVTCFTGFRVKEDMSRMATLIHHMGGSIRRDFIVSKITHLVACTTSGEKYRYAASYGLPVMKEEWINQLWEKRHDPDCLATNESMMVHKLQPFVGCKMAFVAFQDEERKHMEELAVQNGGQVVSPDDTCCSHHVVEDGAKAESISPEAYGRVYVVKTEWFWASIQMEARAEENIYVFEMPVAPKFSSPIVIPTLAKSSKRKRLETVAHHLAVENLHETDFLAPPNELRKKADGAKLSISNSFLDATLSPEKSCLADAPTESTLNESTLKSPLDYRSLTPRHQVCLELFQTETNYVGILDTIISVFKVPLEQEQVGGPLLVPAEVKLIFGNLPPIYEVHHKLRTELAEIIHNWKENCSIGNLILKHAHEILKAYPPFINFFEKTKQVLANCDATKPRFHAFLKRCQGRPECGRQSLQELLIRPVQRLPSVILLLNDILKHTNKHDPDYEALEKGIKAIKEVLTHINEDKRKTEGQMAMFDIVNDIENCPPNLLSSHRNFVTKVDMQEIGDMLSRRNDTITMFLFSDVLEICKKRRRADTLMRSPGVASLASGTLRPLSKCFKHLELMPLTHIKRVVDVFETEECKNFFAIVARSNQELKERLLTFVIIGDDTCKQTFLRTLCRHVANSVCRADSENLLICLEPQQLALQSGDGSNALTKALKIATKTKDKLGRALSMRRTPTKRELSRAVSTFISPLRNLGSPSNSLKTLRLASVTNLAEIDRKSTESLMSTPVGGKKIKASSLGISASKYL